MCFSLLSHVVFLIHSKLTAHLLLKLFTPPHTVIHGLCFWTVMKMENNLFSSDKMCKTAWDPFQLLWKNTPSYLTLLHYEYSNLQFFLLKYFII